MKPQVLGCNPPSALLDLATKLRLAACAGSSASRDALHTPGTHFQGLRCHLGMLVSIPTEERNAGTPTLSRRRPQHSRSCKAKNMSRIIRRTWVSPFGWVSPSEAYEAELFFETLTGRPARRRLAVDPHVSTRPGPGHAGETFEYADNNSAELSTSELRARRRELVRQVSATDLDWVQIPLDGGYSIRICAPVRKGDLYVPVTSGETFAFARRFGAFPLSRAVFDQAHNARQMGDKPKSPSNLLDFVTYSQRMRRSFGDYYGVTILSGAHKLWVVSSLGRIVNYGFHRRPIRGEPFRGGSYLDRNRFNVIQGLGTWHANQPGHWDYSQMLQLMKDLKDPAGRPVDLRRALLDGHPAVWDEPRKPIAAQLPAEGAGEHDEAYGRESAPVLATPYIRPRRQEVAMSADRQAALSTSQSQRT